MTESPEETIGKRLDAFRTFPLLRDQPTHAQALEALASLRQRQEELEDELDAANESIGISREHLSRAGFEAAFLDDVAGLAANEVLSLRTQLQQAETALKEAEKELNALQMGIGYCEDGYGSHECHDPRHRTHRANPGSPRGTPHHLPGEAMKRDPEKGGPHA